MTDAEIDALLDRLMPSLMSRLQQQRPWRAALFVPSSDVYRLDPTAPFMPYSTCSAADFLHPEFHRIMGMIALPREYHRKLWEWVYVIHHLERLGMVAEGRRGLVFGVGQEMLPAIFASRGAHITATDAPPEIGRDMGWQSTAEYASGLATLPSGTLDRKTFEERVEWQVCDMRDIDPALTDYDFCWSSCCFEHLGSIRAGLEFVIASVEKTLKTGGVAIHTTEFNLSSGEDTIEEGSTVLYRRRDIEDLIGELRARGHDVDAFRIAPDSLAIDGYVDTPPYAGPHLKLQLGRFVTTSVGLVIRRGT
jgi:hypothetical protein